MTPAPGGSVKEAPAPARGPGRPRSAECDRAILQATVELLGQEGYGGLSIEGVAARAGVGKTTIYRRWPTKVALVVDAMNEVSPPDTVPEEASTRDALVQNLTGTIGALTGSSAGKVLCGLVHELRHIPELAQAVRAGHVARRRAPIARIVKRGIERGELRPDVEPELVADMLAGPVMYRFLVTGAPLSRRVAERLVDQLLGGIAAAESLQARPAR